MTRLMVGVTVVVTGVTCFACGMSVPKPREVVVVRSPPPDCGAEIERLRAELVRRDVQIDLIRSEVDDHTSFVATAKEIVREMFVR
jgi:hypothetical protein